MFNFKFKKKHKVKIYFLVILAVRLFIRLIIRYLLQNISIILLDIYYRPFQRQGALQVARLERLSSSKTPERRSEKIFEEACKNWLLLLVWAMERCRLCLRTIWTYLLTRLPRIRYYLKPQRPRECKEQSFFWRIWGMARNLRSCGQIRSYSLSRQFTIVRMTGYMQWIRVTSPWMTGWCFGDRNLLLLWSGPG